MVGTLFDTAFSDEAKAAGEAEVVDRSKRIEFYLTEFSIEILANKMKDGEFVVPSYQREFIWEPSRKSRFIESILMGLPIPFLFFWEMPNGKLEIVDGSQRLRTLHEWIHGDLRLTQLEELPSLSHSRFTDLEESRQRKVKNRSIRGIVLNEHADEQARFDMFDRINTGSKAANKAEVRRGALGGPFLDLVIELAKRPEFAALAPATEKAEKEREREELVTRFFAYGDGLAGYKDRPALFMYEYAKRKNLEFEADNAQIAAYRNKFLETMAFVSANFPNGFKKTRGAKVTPRARFESIAIGSLLAISIRPKILKDGPKIPVSRWIHSTQFADITTSDGANVLSKLTGRINFVRDKLLA